MRRSSTMPFLAPLNCDRVPLSLGSIYSGHENVEAAPIAGESRRKSGYGSGCAGANRPQDEFTGIVARGPVQACLATPLVVDERKLPSLASRCDPNDTRSGLGSRKSCFRADKVLVRASRDRPVIAVEVVKGDRILEKRVLKQKELGRAGTAAYERSQRRQQQDGTRVHAFDPAVSRTGHMRQDFDHEAGKRHRRAKRASFG